MKTTIEEILNNALVGKTITLYVGANSGLAGKYFFTTPDKRENTIQTHKRIIKSVDIWFFDSDDKEIRFYLTEPIIGNNSVAFDLYSLFEIEDTPIPMYTAEDNDPWKSGPYDSL